MAFNLEPYWKYVTVGHLREILSGLEDDLLLVPNLVGNLSVVRGEEYVGFIDIVTETVELNTPTGEGRWHTLPST